MARIPLFSPEQMTSDQEAVYRKVLAGPRNEVVGPLRAVMHVPELADRWQQLGEYLRFDTSLPLRLNELAILVTARRWNAQLEWQIHAQAALSAGLGEEAVQTIREAAPPIFAAEDEQEVYEFARSLNMTGNVPDTVYQAVLRRWGTVGSVELSSVVGYYTMVAMTLNAHRIPVPAVEANQVMPLPAPDASGSRPLTEIPLSRGTSGPGASGPGRQHPDEPDSPRCGEPGERT